MTTHSIEVKDIRPLIYLDKNGPTNMFSNAGKGYNKNDAGIKSKGNLKNFFSSEEKGIFEQKQNQV